MSGQNHTGQVMAAQAWEAHAGQPRHRHGYGRLMHGRPGQAQVWGWEAHAGQARNGLVGRLRIGIEENVGDAVVQIQGTGSGFCFGPDLKNSGTEKGQVSEK